MQRLCVQQCPIVSANQIVPRGIREYKRFGVLLILKWTKGLRCFNTELGNIFSAIAPSFPKLLWPTTHWARFLCKRAKTAIWQKYRQRIIVILNKTPFLCFPTQLKGFYYFVYLHSLHQFSLYSGAKSKSDKPHFMS